MGTDTPKPPTIKNEVQRHLAALIGRKLSIARRAADMRVFHFGQVTVEDARRSYGEFSLHIQCPWRIEGPDGIVTGHSDLWEAAEPSEDVDWDRWDYDQQPNLQDRRIGELFAAYVAGESSYVNDRNRFVVERVEADDVGGAAIALSGGYRIVIFPAGTRSEDWRLFHKSWSRHFVVSGGTIERAPDAAG